MLSNEVILSKSIVAGDSGRPALLAMILDPENFPASIARARRNNWPCESYYPVEIPQLASNNCH